MHIDPKAVLLFLLFKSAAFAADVPATETPAETLEPEAAADHAPLSSDSAHPSFNTRPRSTEELLGAFDAEDRAKLKKMSDSDQHFHAALVNSNFFRPTALSCFRKATCGEEALRKVILANHQRIAKDTDKEFEDLLRSAPFEDLAAAMWPEMQPRNAQDWQRFGDTLRRSVRISQLLTHLQATGIIRHRIVHGEMAGEVLEEFAKEALRSGHTQDFYQRIFIGPPDLQSPLPNVQEAAREYSEQLVLSLIALAGAYNRDTGNLPNWHGMRRILRPYAKEPGDTANRLLHAASKHPKDDIPVKVENYTEVILPDS